MTSVVYLKQQRRIIFILEYSKSDVIDVIMFKLSKYDSAKKIIQWNVPFYPQKDTNSCWYYSTEMLLSAYYNQKTKPRVSGFNKFSAQIFRLDDENEHAFLSSNNLLKRVLALNQDPDSFLDILFQYLQKYGPILSFDGHVFPIIGVDCKQKNVFIHYTIPMVYQQKSSGELERSRRFWMGGKQSERSEIMLRQDQGYSPIDAWCREENYAFIQQHWFMESDYKQYSLGKFMAEWEALPRPESRSFTDEEMALHLSKPLAEIRRLAPDDKVFFADMIQSDKTKEEKDFYVASHLFSPSVMNSVQNMWVPVDWFCHLLKRHNANNKFSFLVFCPDYAHRQQVSALHEALFTT